MAPLKDIGRACQKCGRVFVCDLEAGKAKCWCQDYPAVLPVKPNEKCMCPECLKVAIDSINHQYD